MRFEVNVDDGTSNFAALHKARDAYNAQHPDAPAPDLPSFVQRLVDNAVARALEPIVPSSMSTAMARITQLESDKEALALEVKALTPDQAAQAKPA